MDQNVDPSVAPAAAPEQMAFDIREIHLAADEAERTLRAALDEIWRREINHKPRACPKCRKAVTFVLSRAGKWMVLDPRPAIAGNIAILRTGAAKIADVNPPADVPGFRYFHHRVTCGRVPAAKDPWK